MGPDERQDWDGKRIVEQLVACVRVQADGT